MDIQVGHRIAGRYRIEAVLGAGGMGIVTLAHDLELDRAVALKLSRDSHEAERRERFEREARTLARVSHPNVVEVLDFGSDQGHHYLVMRRVEGRRLQPLAPGEPALPLMLPVAEALQAIHDAGTLHRDVKPSNLLVDTSGQAVLVDFGLAYDTRGRVTRLTRDGSLLGTVGFTDPAGLFQRLPDATLDWYGWGGTLYWLRAGRPPYTREQLQASIRSGVLPELPDLAPVAHPGERVLIEACLGTNLEHRPADLRALLDLLPEGALADEEAQGSGVVTQPRGSLDALRLGAPAADQDPGRDQAPSGMPGEAPAPPRRGADAVTPRQGSKSDAFSRPPSDAFPRAAPAPIRPVLALGVGLLLGLPLGRWTAPPAPAPTTPARTPTAAPPTGTPLPSRSASSALSPSSRLGPHLVEALQRARDALVDAEHHWIRADGTLLDERPASDRGGFALVAPHPEAFPRLVAFLDQRADLRATVAELDRLAREGPGPLAADPGADDLPDLDADLFALGLPRLVAPLLELAPSPARVGLEPRVGPVSPDAPWVTGWAAAARLAALEVLAITGERRAEFDRLAARATLPEPFQGLPLHPRISTASGFTSFLDFALPLPGGAGAATRWMGRATEAGVRCLRAAHRALALGEPGAVELAWSIVEPTNILEPIFYSLACTLDPWWYEGDLRPHPDPAIARAQTALHLAVLVHASTARRRAGLVGFELFAEVRQRATEQLAPLDPARLPPGPGRARALFFIERLMDATRGPGLPFGPVLGPVREVAEALASSSTKLEKALLSTDAEP